MHRFLSCIFAGLLFFTQSSRPLPAQETADATSQAKAPKEADVQTADDDATSVGWRLLWKRQ